MGLVLLYDSQMVIVVLYASSYKQPQKKQPGWTGQKSKKVVVFVPSLFSCFG